MMDQQSTEEKKQKISRSKARHLRRKRLAAARKTTEGSSVFRQSNTEQSFSLQEPDSIPSKSKARRLRKKKKAGLIEGSEQTLKIERRVVETDNQTELAINSQSQSTFDIVENSDQIKRDSDSKALPEPSDPITIKSNQNRDSSDSLFRTDSHQTFFESNKSSSENPKPFSEKIQDSESTGSSSIPNLKSNRSSKDNKVIKETEGNDIGFQYKKESKNKSEDTSHNHDVKSSNPIKTTIFDSSKTDTASDDDLDSPSSNSSSNLIEQYEINTIEAHDSLGLITRPVKAVLNTTELIENEKNLKISSNSSNSHSVFQPNANVIDLTTYSSSDLIINTDPTSCTLEEQQIIIDFISESSSDLVQNNQLFYINPPDASSAESYNKNKIHKKLVDENLFKSENQSSFDIIKDYSLPSTSVNERSVLPNNSAGYKTIVDSSRGHVFNESEGKMSSAEKTREQVKAEREAKKAAKALAKGKSKAPKSEEKIDPKSSKDASTKAGSSEPVHKDIEQNVVVKKQAVPQENKKIITTGTVTTQSTENKENESEIKDDGKSKKESRAERRAKQEAQRAAKEKLAAEKNKPKSFIPAKAKPLPTVSDPVKMVVRKTLVDNNLHEVKLFKHLYHERELSLVNFPTLNSNIHPAILRLGVQYSNKVIIGSNARCIALLAAVKQLVEDFERPSQADFTRGLEASLQECAAYLHYCRPMAVSMQNALKHLKWQMTQLPTTVSDNDAKSKLGDAIETYIREQILLAGKAISNTIQTKISNGDVILTYAFSSLIHKILTDAHIAGKQFRVIIVDGRPWLEGKEQLRRLAKHGIECSYILINALSFIMPEVSKVFLGAHAILANGAVMSRAGTAQVALMAKAFNVPVLVACETHKSCERVQTDSFVYNEIGDADELARNLFSNSKKSLLLNWKTKKSLDLLNITFDVTPADLISAVVTELAILPCTSIPVILRIKPSEI